MQKYQQLINQIEEKTEKFRENQQKLKREAVDFQCDQQQYIQKCSMVIYDIFNRLKGEFGNSRALNYITKNTKNKLLKNSNPSSENINIEVGTDFSLDNDEVVQSFILSLTRDPMTFSIFTIGVREAKDPSYYVTLNGLNLDRPYSPPREDDPYAHTEDDTVVIEIRDRILDPILSIVKNSNEHDPFDIFLSTIEKNNMIFLH